MVAGAFSVGDHRQVRHRPDGLDEAPERPQRLAATHLRGRASDQVDQRDGGQHHLDRGAGHWVAREAPEQVNAALDAFLDGV